MTRGGAGPAAGAAGRGDPGRSRGSELSTDTTKTTTEGSSAAVGTILIADDNEDCRIALSALLEALGHTVHEAEDGESAVAVAEREAPDLILMDIMMPGVDGLEATRRIRSSPALDDVRIVAVTAMEGARDASLAAGCDDCIFKPVDLDGLDERVAGWMSEG